MDHYIYIYIGYACLPLTPPTKTNITTPMVQSLSFSAHHVSYLCNIPATPGVRTTTKFDGCRFQRQTTVELIGPRARDPLTSKTLPWTEQNKFTTNRDSFSHLSTRTRI